MAIATYRHEIRVAREIKQIPKCVRCKHSEVVVWGKRDLRFDLLCDECKGIVSRKLYLGGREAKTVQRYLIAQS